MDFIEKEGLSVPEAVFSACMTLGIQEKDAQVQVLSAPGSRRVKVRVGKPGVALPAPDASSGHPAPSATASPSHAAPASPASYASSPQPSAAPQAWSDAASPEAQSAPVSRPADYSAKVSIRKQPSPEQAEAARKDFEVLLEKMGTPSTVELREHAGNVVFNIVSEKEGLLIGKRGSTLDALQDALNAMLEASTGDREIFAVVDVAEYRIRQERKIMDKAKELAALVLLDGVQQTMGPLSAAERRLVHMELKEMPGVETFSVGSGSMKKVVIQKKA
jgi:spoIIIJ-associated protein